jgi:hypothetical protein
VTWPTIAVKVSFGTDRFDTPSYTTLAAQDVEGLSIDVGRHSESDGLNPGTCDVTLDNSDREFDPYNTAGTHYPNVQPGKRMQITATFGGVPYQIFNGWVDAWPNDSSSLLGRAVMRSSGAFKLLARTTVPDAYTDAMLADSPAAWYRMGDADEHLMADSSGNGRHGRWLPENIDVSTTDGLIASDDKAVTLPSAPAYVTGVIPQNVISSFRSSTVEMWFRLNGIPKPLPNPLLLGNENFSYLLGGGGIAVRIHSTGATYPGALEWVVADNRVLASAHARVDITATDSGSTWWRSVCDSRPHHLAAYIDSSGGTFFLLDGAVASGLTLSTGAIANVPLWGSPAINTGGGWDGQAVVDEVAFYDSTLGLDRVAAHYAAGLPAGVGETTGARVGRILDLIDWPAGLRDLDDGQHALAGGKDAGEKALDRLELVADTELAVLSEAHDDDGKVRFQDLGGRLADNRSAVSQTLFSDDAGELSTLFAVPYSRIEFPADDRPVANVVTVRWLGNSVTVTDEASVDSYGEIPTTVDTILESYDAAVSLAHWVLDERAATGFARVKSITVEPARMTGGTQDLAWIACLDRAVGDRVRVKHTPTWSGTQIDQELYIIGIEHKADSGIETWETTFHLAPAVAVSYWVLGTSQLGTTTKLAA